MKETQLAPRVLPADVYDALELSALAFGGIGRDFYAWNLAGQSHLLGYDEDAIPCCAYGHAQALDGSEDGDVDVALRAAGITVGVNDDAVGDDERIPFKTWCKRLNVVRGS